MRCPACRTDNEQGRAFCRVCAEELTPGAAADLEPPRARSRAGRRLRRVADAARVQIRHVEEALPGFGELPEAARDAARRLGTCLLALVPGAVHLVWRQRRLGFLLLGATLACALVTWAFLGNTVGWLAATTWASLIWYSLFDTMRFDPATGTRRNQGSDAFMALGLCGAFCALAFTLVGSRLEFVRVRLDIVRLAPPPGRGALLFGRGDMLIALPHAYDHRAPQRGDIVCSTNESGLVRIIGLPGEQVAVKQGRFFVNGKPLAPELYPVQAQGRVAGNAERPANMGAESLAWVEAGAGSYVAWDADLALMRERLMVLSRGEILGKVWRVSAPLAHMRTINHADPQVLEVLK